MYGLQYRGDMLIHRMEINRDAELLRAVKQESTDEDYAFFEENINSLDKLQKESIWRALQHDKPDEPVQNSSATFVSYNELKLRYIALKNRMPATIQQRCHHLLAECEGEGRRWSSDSARRATVLRLLQHLISPDYNEPFPSCGNFIAFREYLDECFGGLDEAKDILCDELFFRENAKHRQEKKSLCFVGPPGTGKSKLAETPADFLRIRLVKFSCAGRSHVEDIIGTPELFENAQSSKIVLVATEEGCYNLLVIFEEIDKFNMTGKEDPVSVLVNILEGNGTFQDEFIGNVDVSNVIFICTANDESKIPSALRDRLQIVYCDGYSVLQQKTIAKDYLWPKLLSAYELHPNDLPIEDEALDLIVTEYNMTSGMRTIRGHLERLRDRALRLRSAGADKVINAQFVREVLPPMPTTITHRSENEIGEVCLLAVDSEGAGHIVGLQVDEEVNCALQMTGHLEETTRESIELAYHVLKRYSDYDLSGFRVHFCDMGIAKNGSSAGMMVFLAMVSAVERKPVATQYIGTGELDLRGNIRAVGGIKGKVMAALRLGYEKLLVPQGNFAEASRFASQKDSEHKLQIIPVSNITEAANWVFGEGNHRVCLPEKNS